MWAKDTEVVSVYFLLDVIEFAYELRYDSRNEINSTEIIDKLYEIIEKDIKPVIDLDK